MERSDNKTLCAIGGPQMDDLKHRDYSPMNYRGTEIQLARSLLRIIR
jgi:hypothetical protein